MQSAGYPRIWRLSLCRAAETDPKARRGVWDWQTGRDGEPAGKRATAGPARLAPATQARERQKNGRQKDESDWGDGIHFSACHLFANVPVSQRQKSPHTATIRLGCDTDVADSERTRIDHFLYYPRHPGHNLLLLERRLAAAGGQSSDQRQIGKRLEHQFQERLLLELVIILSIAIA